MEQILVLGNEETRSWSSNIPKSFFLQMPSYSLSEDGENNLMEFIIQNVPEDISAVIIDIDHSSNREICLAFAMALRLCIHDIKAAAFAPIVLMSRMSFEALWGTKYSQIILTKAVICESPDNIIGAIDVLKPLSADEYHDNFLNLIKLFPNAAEGRHSLANQWGANVLNRTLLGRDLDNPIIRKSKQSLYFKYIRALTYKPQQILSIISSNNDTESLLSAIEDLPNASNKNILLIDDEADKGWATVLSDICKGANLELSQKRVNDFNELDEDIRNKIKSDYYDLIFLDLRLNGLNEEDIKRPEDFSGVKILQKIKDKINRGIQVIILTASNKAWNMKILLESGADGYYIKESPEYAFPQSYSEKNAETLLDEIDICLERGYLKVLFRNIERLKHILSNTIFSESTNNRITKQLDVSYLLLNNAKTDEEFAYSYITLEAIFEIISAELLEKKNKREYEIIDTAETCKNWDLRNKRYYETECYDTKTPSLNDYPTWKRICSIYYQLLNGKKPFFGSKVFHLIETRNAFIHNNKEDQNKRIRINQEEKLIYKDIYNKDGFVRLFDTIYELIVLIANSLS